MTYGRSAEFDFHKFLEICIVVHLSAVYYVTSPYRRLSGADKGLVPAADTIER